MKTDLLWELFKKTGNIKYYNLLKKEEKKNSTKKK